MRLALVLAAVVMGVSGFFAMDAQAGSGDRDEGRQRARIGPQDARQPAPQVRQPVAQPRQPVPQVRQPAPVARPAAPVARQPVLEIRRVAPLGRGWNQQAELARRQAEERRREMEQARALMARADELVRQAGELEAARTSILEKVAAMRREARGFDRGRHLGWEKGKQPAGRRLDVQAVNNLLEQAKSLAAAKERLLASAAALHAQAQGLMAHHAR